MSTAVRDPALQAIGAYAVVAMAAAAAAYFAIFTLFQSYDDEGTLLVALQAFAQGDALYRDVYSPYGPFYYELFGGLAALTGQEVTTDLSRSTVIVIWVATAFLYGISAQRLTGRLLLGMAAMIAAFGALYVLANEPMHPQGLCVLLLAAFSAIAIFGPGRRPLWGGAMGGGVLAALFLTKLNLGVFALAAAALAAALAAPALCRRPWLRWSAAGAVLVLPVLLAAADLGVAWVRDFVALEVLSLAAIVLVAWPRGNRAGEDGQAIGRWLIGAVVGFGIAFIAILVGVLLSGPSLGDVYDGIVTEASRVRDVLLLEFEPASEALDWSIAGLAVAAIVARVRFDGGGRTSIWPGALRALAGLAIWLTVSGAAPGLNPSSDNPASLAMVLAWVAAVPPPGVNEGPYRRFVRILLPLLAVAVSMQIYPVGGSQTGIAALSFVPVGALCLGDALTSLRAWSEARGGSAAQRFGFFVAVLAVAITAELALDRIASPLASNAIVYSDRERPPLDGAGHLRLEPAQAETYADLVELLRSHRCTDLIGYPNVNSLYIWSGIKPPPPAAPGAWIKALDAKRQQRIVDELRASPRPCAFRNDELATFWLREDPPPDRPLVNYLLNEFRVVERVGEFQFMLPRP